jgi:hypothetical protein
VAANGRAKAVGLRSMAAAMARRTRTSSSGFFLLLMARIVLAREPAMITWNFLFF